MEEEKKVENNETPVTVQEENKVDSVTMLEEEMEKKAEEQAKPIETKTDKKDDNDISSSKALKVGIVAVIIILIATALIYLLVEAFEVQGILEDEKENGSAQVSVIEEDNEIIYTDEELSSVINTYNLRNLIGRLYNPNTDGSIKYNTNLLDEFKNKFLLVYEIMLDADNVKDNLVIKSNGTTDLSYKIDYNFYNKYYLEYFSVLSTEKEINDSFFYENGEQDSLGDDINFNIEEFKLRTNYVADNFLYTKEIPLDTNYNYLVLYNNGKYDRDNKTYTVSFDYLLSCELQGVTCTKEYDDFNTYSESIINKEITKYQEDLKVANIELNFKIIDKDNYQLLSLMFTK